MIDADKLAAAPATATNGEFDHVVKDTLLIAGDNVINTIASHTASSAAADAAGQVASDIVGDIATDAISEMAGSILGGIFDVFG